jgi:hypothetical protein
MKVVEFCAKYIRRKDKSTSLHRDKYLLLLSTGEVMFTNVNTLWRHTTTNESIFLQVSASIPNYIALMYYYAC